MLNEEIKRRIDQISAINMVAASVGHSLDLDVTLNTAMEAVTEVLGTEAAGISLIDNEAKEVVLRAQLGWLNDFVKENPMRIPLGKGMSGQVISNDDAIVHNDLADEEYAVASFGKEEFRSIVMAPMHARGRIIGILSIMSKQTNRFDGDTVDVLKAIADTIGVAVDNARLHEQHVEQENRLNAILHSTADGIVATDQNSRIQMVNQAAAQMLDVEPQDLIGVPVREALIQVDIREKLIKALLPESDEADKRFQVSIRSEVERELSVHVSPVQITSQLNGGNSRDGWVIVLQDITFLKEAEVTRVQFIQAAAHDMKNPLSVAQKSISMLESMLEYDDEMMREVIEIAHTGLGRVQRLIDDLLQIEKIESGYYMQLDDVDVREMCFEMSASIMPVMRSRNIDYDMQIDKETPIMVQLDRDWIQRALSNYLENAGKYAPNGKVVFSVYPNEGSIHFEVIDNGPGIPLRAQARLFDRFYRVENRRDVKGSGLGLAIVKSVAEAHGGSVYVRSQEGEGSTFGMMLPIR